MAIQPLDFQVNIAQQTKVEAANQPESEKVEPEGKRGSGYSPGERKKKEEEEEGKKEDLPKDPTKGRLIDVLK